MNKTLAQWLSVPVPYLSTFAQLHFPSADRTVVVPSQVPLGHSPTATRGDPGMNAMLIPADYPGLKTLYSSPNGPQTQFGT